MKILLLVIGTFCYNVKVFAQPDIESFCKEFPNKIAVYACNYPLFNSADTCIRLDFLLKLQIDKKGNVVDVVFSDSAPLYYKKDVTRQIKKWGISKIKDLGVKHKVLATTIIFPFYSKSEHDCNNMPRYELPANYYTFNNEYNKAKIFLGSPINVIISNHNIKR